MIVTEPVLSVFTIIAALGALTMLFVFFELRKKHRYPTLRTIAIIIMMISLAGIMLRPRYTTTISSAVLLLTPGYSEDQVDSILEQNPKLSVMHLMNTQPFREATLLRDADITKYKIDFVLGEGFPLHQLDRIDKATFDYIPTPLPFGLVELSLEENYLPHRKGTISGIYNNKSGETLISLYGPADAEDSITIYEKGQHRFSLSFTPRKAGNFAYSLIVRDSTSTTGETVPVHVDDERRLNIFFLHSFPSFESQYLKSYLAEKNHSLILRYQLSKNDFRHEFVNREGEPVSRLSEDLLSNIDLLIADAPSLATLSSREKISLERSIENGLGLLTLPPIHRARSKFFPFETIAQRKDTASIKPGQKSFILPTSPLRVKKNDTIIPLLTNKSGILSGYAFCRAGKIGFQLLHETYRLRLSGDSLSYSEIWAPLIEKVARTREQNSKINISTPFPWYEDEPIEIEIISSGENFQLIDDSVQIPLRENISVDNVWHARTWASKKGWHTLQTSDGSVTPYYIQARPAWKALATTNQIRINSERVSADTDNQAKPITTVKDIPRFIFYLTLIVSSGFVWLSPKL
jgi:hypothetical protein